MICPKWPEGPITYKQGYSEYSSQLWPYEGRVVQDRFSKDRVFFDYLPAIPLENGNLIIPNSAIFMRFPNRISPGLIVKPKLISQKTSIVYRTQKFYCVSQSNVAGIKFGDIVVCKRDAGVKMGVEQFVRPSDILFYVGAKGINAGPEYIILDKIRTKLEYMDYTRVEKYCGVSDGIQYYFYGHADMLNIGGDDKFFVRKDQIYGTSEDAPNISVTSTCD